MVLVVDDLQSADTPSLLLLQFVAREIGEVPLLIVGTYRDVELRRHHPLAETLGELARAPSSRSLVLEGLTLHDVARFIELATDRVPAATLVTAVHRKTEGNPFFLTEVLRLLATEGHDWTLARPEAAIGVPHRVREAIDLRLRALSEDCQRLLAVAAVIGREFSLGVLEAVAAIAPASPGGGIAALLDEAVAVRLVAVAPNHVGRYSFSHALVRDTLRDGLSAAQRMQLHAHVGAALEAIHDGDLESHSAELAHHFLQAAPAGLAEKAVAYAVRAAERAMRQLAYEEAVNQYGHALQALDQLHPLPARQHCELRLALADALWQAGESPRARENFLHAAQSARAQGAADLLARAALGLGRVRAETGLVDDELVGLLEAALAALSPDDSALRARTLARLAMALYFSRACAERRDALSMQALAMAQRVGDAGALAFALLARHFVLWGAGSVTERLALATEVVRLAEAGGDLGVAMEGRAWRILALLELGDIAAVDQEIEGYARQSFRLRLPRNQWYLSLVRSARAFLAGRFVEGEQLAVEAAGVRGEGGELANAGMFFGAQLFTLRREQGRLGELEPALTAFAAQFEALPIWRCSLAVFFAELGDHDRARRELEHLAAQDFAALPHDANRLPALALLSEACSMLGDAQRAALLYETLLPYAARNIVVATAAICYGPAARYLGLLASTLARWDDAEVHFADALAMAERMGARPWTAHTRHDHARMLMARGAPGDRRMAGELLEQAQASAGELGMQALEDKVRALRHQIAASRSDGPARASLEPPISRSVEGEGALPPDASVFRREGDYWTIAYQHRVLRLRDCAGARYLSHLLQHPYREFHAFELVDLGSPPRRAAAFAARSGGPGTPAATGLHVAGAADAGPVLDSKTRAAYKRRLADLRSELDEARDFNDIGRIDHLQHEAAFLSQELAAGLGLNQQYRRAASSADQARVNVTRAIKRAIQKIAGQHRALGLHLANAINTGLFCSYLPDPRVPIWWLS